jgi:predicted nucleic acid-binding Zn ribbon protein
VYNKICVICAKPFTTHNSHYKTCSPQCSVAYDKEYRKAYDKYRRDAGLIPNRYVKVVRHCKLCNNRLPDGRQTYCLYCLVDGFVHGDKDFRKKCGGILNCRVYSVEDIWDEADCLNLL